MKAFKARFEHGHFIDTETKKRIIPRQGAIFHISADDKAFTTEDSKLKVATALNTEEKRLWAAKKYGENNIMRIMNSTDTLFFRIGNSTLAEGDESIQYILLCKLMEDLYIYRMQGKDAADPKSWRLAESKCQLEKCLMGGLTLSVNVPASSLNELFNRTVQFYFSLQRSGSASAFNTFYPYDPQLHITFEGAKWKHYKALSDLRKLAVKKSNKNTRPPLWFCEIGYG